MPPYGRYYSPYTLQCRAYTLQCRVYTLDYATPYTLQDSMWVVGGEFLHRAPQGSMVRKFDLTSQTWQQVLTHLFQHQIQKT